MPELFVFWAAFGLVGAAVETWAIRRKRKGDSLSESVRWLLVERFPKVRWVTAAGWLAFALWFFVHIWL